MNSRRNAPVAASPITRRPLSARSVIASILLGTHPPRMPTRLLVRTAELFGISPGTTRVAISRMARAGELRPDGDGYHLAGRLLDRQARQDHSRAAPRTDWDGTWSMAIATGTGRDAAERASLRRALTNLEFAPLRDGTWLRPDNLDPDRLPTDRDTVSTACDLFRATPSGDPVALAHRLWDLDAWASTANDLRAPMAHWCDRLGDGDETAIAPAFELSAGVVRHLLDDPLLPDQLLPDDWPGDVLRRDYDELNTAFRDAYVAWLLAQQ